MQIVNQMQRENDTLLPDLKGAATPDGRASRPSLLGELLNMGEEQLLRYEGWLTEQRKEFEQLRAHPIGQEHVLEHRRQRILGMQLQIQRLRRALASATGADHAEDEELFDPNIERVIEPEKVR